jgi:hypothetical protein
LNSVRAPLFPFSFSSRSTLLFALLFFFSRRVVSIIFSLLLSFLHHAVTLFFMLLLSISHCYYSPLCIVVLLFMLLLSSLCYYCCPLCSAAFLIALLLSFLHCLVFLFMLLGFSLHNAWFSFSHCCSPLRLLLYFKYKVLCTTILLFMLLLLVCCYSLKNLVFTPCIPSCKNWEWLGIKNQKLSFFQ